MAYLESYTETALELNKALKLTTKERVKDNMDSFRQFVEGHMNKMETTLFSAYQAGEISKEQYEDITQVHDHIMEDYKHIVGDAKKIPS